MNSYMQQPLVSICIPGLELVVNAENLGLSGNCNNALESNK
jgi:hypothetical protein